LFNTEQRLSAEKLLLQKEKEWAAMLKKAKRLANRALESNFFFTICDTIENRLRQQSEKIKNVTSLRFQTIFKDTFTGDFA
jgi:hypothetical protein